jgi:hypothetical protein
LPSVDEVAHVVASDLGAKGVAVIEVRGVANERNRDG